MSITMGSLFSGYLGLDMAVESVIDARTAWVADIDPGARKVLAHRLPDVPNLGDVTSIDWATVEPVDIITGGYPCQPFSTAGRRRGQEDERHLWPYVADALAALRPTFAVFENVRGHLTLGFDEVVRDLHLLGYDIEWRLIRASDIGACHQRARLFILGVNREPRVCSRPDRRRGLHRDSSDGWELSGPTQGEHVRQGAPSASRTGEAVRRPREAGQEGDGADASLAHLGAHGRGGSDRDSQAPSAISDQRGRGGRGPGVRSDAHRVTQAAEPRSSLDRGDARTCRDAETAHPGGESTRPGPGAAGSAGHCPDCGVSLGVVVGAGGQLVRPGGVRGEVPNEREDDLGPRVRAASGADVLAWRRDAADADHAGRSEQRWPVPVQPEHAATECVGDYLCGGCRRTYDLSARRTTSDTVSPRADVAAAAATHNSSSMRMDRGRSPYLGAGTGDQLSVGDDLTDSELRGLNVLRMDGTETIVVGIEPAHHVAVAESDTTGGDSCALADHPVAALDEASGTEACEPYLVEAGEMGDVVGMCVSCGAHGKSLTPVHTYVNTDRGTTLPTPRASDANGPGAHGAGGPDLRTVAAMLPTPRATDGTKGGPNQRGSSGDLMLPSAVAQLLPSPVAQPSGNSPEEHLRKKPGRKVVTDLSIIVENGLLETGGLLPTPTTTQRGSDANLDTREGARANLHNEVNQRFGRYAAAVARQESAFGHPAPSPTEPAAKPLNRHGNSRANPRLSARFCEWMMGLPAGWITDVPGVTRNEALKLAGNGVVPQQATAALRDMLPHALAALTERTAA